MVESVETQTKPVDIQARLREDTCGMATASEFINPAVASAPLTSTTASAMRNYSKVNTPTAAVKLLSKETGRVASYSRLDAIPERRSAVVGHAKPAPGPKRGDLRRSLLEKADSAEDGEEEDVFDGVSAEDAMIGGSVGKRSSMVRIGSDAFLNRSLDDDQDQAVDEDEEEDSVFVPPHLLRERDDGDAEWCRRPASLMERPRRTGLDGWLC